MKNRRVPANGEDGGEQNHRTPTRAEAEKLAGMINVEPGAQNPQGFRVSHHPGRAADHLNSPLQPPQSLIEGMIAVLSSIFAMAVDSELIAANPVADIGRSLRLSREMKKEFAPFTGAEALSFS